MIWFGLADFAKTDWKRALEIAKTTPLAELADSIVWYAAQEVFHEVAMGAVGPALQAGG